MAMRQSLGGVGLFVLFSLVFVSGGSHAGAGGPLSLDERVAAQQAIEDVYWRHRIWPEANPTPKPPLSAVLSDEAIRARVEDHLKMANALRKWWHRPVTAAQLQAELDRMTRDTRDPEMLRELFAALDNDPRLIVETLARPALVERLARRWYASDERFHGAVELGARVALSDLPDVAAMRAFGNRYVEESYALRSERRRGEIGDAGSSELDADEWQTWTSELAQRFGTEFDAIPLGTPTDLQEDVDRFFVTALLSRSDFEATVVTVTWPKRSFETWWNEQRELFAPDAPTDSETYTINAPTGEACADDTWDTRYYGPGVRGILAAVWTGSELIVWGGGDYLNTGGRYDPATETWRPTSVGDGVPSGRRNHTGIWTGTEMIVWGGNASDGQTSTGGRYDPLTDRWTPTSTDGAPSARTNHTAVWIGTEMFVWGGTAGHGQTSTGGRYDPATDTWVATSIAPGTPFPMSMAECVWTGAEVIVWGGYWDGVYLAKGSRYDPVTDSWVPIAPDPDTPFPRGNFTLVWTGTEMILWGGGTGSSWTDTGGRYDPLTDDWVPTSTGNDRPQARQHHTAVWTGTEMIIWGGSTGNGVSYTGSRYDPLTDDWDATWSGPGHPSQRAYHAAVWTGTEMIVWGGEGPGRVDLGGRYDPVLNAWESMAPGSDVPLWRKSHIALWTGAEMIIWGGTAGGQLDSGGRYYPATDLWLPTGPVAPSRRLEHTAVWTGTEMIVWGGYSYYPHLYLWTGSRYDPMMDTWSPTSTGANRPEGRRSHSAVWSGTEMIVWGGSANYPSEYFTSGGRYDPVTDSWAPLTEDENTPGARSGHSAVWTGTEMIVWGGYDGDSRVVTGGRFDPQADLWQPTSVDENTPTSRSGNSVVWTGSEMIVWGGFADWQVLNTGARYDPSTDGWIPTSVGIDTPTLSNHGAVWTGDQMIVWGGYGVSKYLDTGGRYHPATDSWTPTSMTGSPYGGRLGHTAVWTGSEMIVWGGSPPACEVNCYCAASCSALVPSAPPDLAATRSGMATLLSWDAVADAEAYDVVMGSLSMLRSSEGDFSSSTTGCLENDLAATTASDDSIPSPGDAHWYLVRAVSCAGNGSYDTGLAAQPESRDAGIAAADGSCP